MDWTPPKTSRAFHVLCCVYDEPGAWTSGLIADDLGHASKHIATDVGRLIRADLLERREGLLYITPDGVALVESLVGMEAA